MTLRAAMANAVASGDLRRNVVAHVPMPRDVKRLRRTGRRARRRRPGVYVDDETGEPTWLAVTTGWSGTNVSFVPFVGSYLGGDELVVAYRRTS